MKNFIDLDISKNHSQNVLTFYLNTGKL